MSKFMDDICGTEPLVPTDTESVEKESAEYLGLSAAVIAFIAGSTFVFVSFIAYMGG